LSAKTAQDLDLIQIVNTISSLPQADKTTGNNAKSSIPVSVKKKLPLSRDLPVQRKLSDKTPISRDSQIQSIIENNALFSRPR